MNIIISLLQSFAGHAKDRSRSRAYANKTGVVFSLMLLSGLGLSVPLEHIAHAHEAATEAAEAPPWPDLFHPDRKLHTNELERVIAAERVTPELAAVLREITIADAESRAALIRQLNQPGGMTPDQFVIALMDSEHFETKRIGIRLSGQGIYTAAITAKLKDMLASEPDQVLQAEARLALAEHVHPAEPLQLFESAALQPAVTVPALLPIPIGHFEETAESPALSTSDHGALKLGSSRIRDANFMLASGSLSEVSTSGRIPRLLSTGLAGAAITRLVSSDGGEEEATGRARVIQLPNLPGFGTEEESVVPPILDRPLLTPDDLFVAPPDDSFDDVLLAYGVEAPLGYTGRSGILSEDPQENSHFVPMPDRWRSGFPPWDRYGKGHPHDIDYPYAEGMLWDPYRQNVLKGDYPFIGQHTFFRFTGQVDSIQEYRQLPVATTPFESTVNPSEEQFFGNPNQYFTTNYFKASFEVFHGNAGFKPVDWSIRLTPIFNINYLNVQELGVVKPNVRNGTTRYDDFMALEEYFIEAKLADLSPDYDFLSARAGSQPFTSDFRGFIFSDINRAVRLFGTRLANRDQFNLIFFDQTEKDTNSQLNTFDDRHQNTLIANYYRQDFFFPGYTAEASVHYNRDGPSVKYDTNGFLVRPDPAGVALPHQVDSVYLGFAGEGHIGRFNIANAAYWVVGRDTMNPIAGQKQNINAQMAAIELSYDRDWIRFRSSFFYASGDDNAYNKEATGFDTIFDNPNFAGGQFSFWQRQQIQLLGVSLVNRFSLVPDLRSSKFQGQTNFVNPGLHLFNLGMDFDLTPKLRLITNANYLEFDKTGALEQFVFQGGIAKSIGVDLSAGLEYRPYLNDNVIFEGGYAALVPGRGFDDLYGKNEPFTTANATNYKSATLHQVFMQMALTF